MNRRGESRLVHKSADFVFEGLPNVNLGISGRLAVKPDDDFKDASKTRNQYDQFLNWRIDEDADEFVIRFSRKPEAPSRGHINVDVKIEEGLSTQPDGSGLFDSGLGNGESNKVCKFSLSFEISHESSPDSDSDSDSQEEWEKPEQHEIKFFHHPKHKLLLAPENYYNDAVIDNTRYVTCDACMEPVAGANARWVYECPNKPDCDYCVHAKCAQLARTIRHPSHPKHSLKLLVLEPGFARGCDVCEAEISRGLCYNCAKCNFDLHSECPKPEEARGDEADDTEEEEEEEEECVTKMTPAMMQLQLMEIELRMDMTQQLASSIANIGAGVYDLS